MNSGSGEPAGLRHAASSFACRSDQKHIVGVILLIYFNDYLFDSRFAGSRPADKKRDRIGQGHFNGISLLWSKPNLLDVFQAVDVFLVVSLLRLIVKQPDDFSSNTILRIARSCTIKVLTLHRYTASIFDDLFDCVHDKMVAFQQAHQIRRFSTAIMDGAVGVSGRRIFAINTGEGTALYLLQHIDDRCLDAFRRLIRHPKFLGQFLHHGVGE